MISGSVDLGGGLLPGRGEDVFIAKYDASGTHIWSKNFGDRNTDAGLGVAVDDADNILVTGVFCGTVDFGGGPFTCVGGQFDAFLAKFDASGNHLWSNHFGGTGTERGYSVATDASGNVVVTGSFERTVDFGGGSLTTSHLSDIFVAKYDANGNHLWSHRFGNTRRDEGFGISVDSSDNVLVTGYTGGLVDFGGGPLDSPGLNDIFVVKLEPDGNHVWSRTYGDYLYNQGNGITLDEAGDVFVTGSFSGTVDFGGGPFTATPGFDDMFLIKLDPNGSHLWSKAVGGNSLDRGIAVAVDGLGHVVATGRFRGTADFGGGPITSEGQTHDVFLAKYDSHGNHVWSRGFSGTGQTDIGNGVAFNASGNVLVTGTFNFTADFGSGPFNSAGIHDIFVAKFGDVAPEIGVYFDEDLKVQFKECPGNGTLDFLYVATSNWDFSLDRLEYTIDYPPSLTFLQDLVAPSVGFALGTSPTGVAIHFSAQFDALRPVLIQRVLVLWNCDNCDEPVSIDVVPHQLTGSICGHQTSTGRCVIADGRAAQVCYLTPTLDVRPGLCPNPFGKRQIEFAVGSNPRTRGVLPVAVLGSETFDVTQIDLSTIRLEGVEPAMSVGGPKTGDIATAPEDDSDCSCSNEGPDGFKDLTMEFPAAEIAAVVALGASGDETALTLTGTLYDGTPFEATDCVVFVGVQASAPTEPIMHAASPNPFNPVTRIPYVLPTGAVVNLSVYDVRGRLVEELVNGPMPAGEHVVEWKAVQQPSGIYFYRLEVGSYSQTRKMVLLK